MTKSIVIAEKDNIAAVLENGKVTDFFVNKGEIFLNDVYLATVDNILPSIEAAFVNVGSDKMGFLHANDVPGKGNLKNKLTPKQKLIVQVVKEPTGHKGPRVTTAISLPGRFLVLIPQETGINVSRKIVSAKERARLKSTVSLIKPVGIGVIVRTEAEGQTESDIQEDLELLLEKWNTIITSAETQEAPSLLYRDQDLLYRVMREACTEDTTEIVLDTPFAMQRTQQILQSWNMNKNIQLSVYKGTEPLLQASGIIKEIKAALQTKVMLPSGGYLFIQTTEALSVVDVNSGKFVSSATQDETILKTNIEAAHEIARQLRLRNIGGMIIIDFIDMTNRNDKLAVMEEFELALENDKAKPQIGQLSDLGLVELTRHRQGQSISEVFTKKCPHCGGTGMIFDEPSPATASGEGELKAKAAKLKVPVQQLKNKNNRFNSDNKVFNNRLAEPESKPEMIIKQDEEPSTTGVSTSDSVTNNNEIQANAEYRPQQGNRFNNRFKSNKFNKNKNRFNKFRNDEYRPHNNITPIDNPPQATDSEFKAPKAIEPAVVSVPKVTETKPQEVKPAEKNTVPEPKKRGRKPKSETAKATAKATEKAETATSTEPKKRGRKPGSKNKVKTEAKEVATVE